MTVGGIGLQPQPPSLMLMQRSTPCEYDARFPNNIAIEGRLIANIEN